MHYRTLQDREHFTYQVRAAVLLGLPVMQLPYSKGCKKPHDFLGHSLVAQSS